MSTSAQIQDQISKIVNRNYFDTKLLSLYILDFAQFKEKDKMIESILSLFNSNPLVKDNLDKISDLTDFSSKSPLRIGFVVKEYENPEMSNSDFVIRTDLPEFIKEIRFFLSRVSDLFILQIECRIDHKYQTIGKSHFEAYVSNLYSANPAQDANEIIRGYETKLERYFSKFDLGKCLNLNYSEQHPCVTIRVLEKDSIDLSNLEWIRTMKGYFNYLGVDTTIVSVAGESLFFYQRDLFRSTSDMPKGLTVVATGDGFEGYPLFYLHIFDYLFMPLYWMIYIMTDVLPIWNSEFQGLMSEISVINQEDYSLNDVKDTYGSIVHFRYQLIIFVNEENIIREAVISLFSRHMDETCNNPVLAGMRNHLLNIQRKVLVLTNTEKNQLEKIEKNGNALIEHTRDTASFELSRLNNLIQKRIMILTIVFGIITGIATLLTIFK